MANPTLLDMPIAVNGAKNVIPSTTADPGLATQNAGFPPETSLPLNAGGIAPSREDFNGLFNLVSGVAFYAQKGAFFQYEAGQDYYKGCCVIDPTDNQRYECIADMSAGTIAPSSDSTNTYWRQFSLICCKDAASHNSIYRGAEITDSWATIQTNIQNGDFSNYYIGDYKQITLTTNETVIMEIAGINCYKNWGNGSPVIGNHIDFISRDCLATAYQMNTTATNNGTSSSREYPFGASKLYASLNGTLEADLTGSVLVTLPSDVRNAIAGKRIYLEKRYSSGGAVSADTGAGWVSINLWLPSEVEVYGHAIYSEVGYGTAGFMQYPIFRLNPSKIVKGAGNGGIRSWWWDLSADARTDSMFCYVTSYGNAGRNVANDTTVRVPLCFRIA